MKSALVTTFLGVVATRKKMDRNAKSFICLIFSEGNTIIFLDFKPLQEIELKGCKCQIANHIFFYISCTQSTKECHQCFKLYYSCNDIYQ